jgi:UDP-N-acetylglucosamine--N-acetylmuramyl-(pentapeptide) pyrophosphoryl-undecaprenol N-acetylglucosamine transferase
MTAPLILLSAGGTGGHLFPAQALAEELVRRGHVVHLMSDHRVTQYGGRFPATQVHEIASATLTPRRPWKLPAQLRQLWLGYRKAQAVLRELKPEAVVGFGGYPSVPPLLAASSLGLPMVLHEQNAVMGRANRFLASRAHLIASSFPDIANLDRRHRAKMVVTGNPVRQDVLDAAARAYTPPDPEAHFRLVVFGGSQGARFFSELMPGVIEEMPKAVRRRLAIVQQCRPEDLDGVRRAYGRLEVEAELQPFFADMPQRIADSHLVICRSGASSIAELAVIGRPAVLVPLPHSLDNDQLRNAQAFAAAGAGWVWRQGEFGPDELGAFLTRLRFEKEELATAAAAARSQGGPDAAERLADAVEGLIGNRKAGAGDATPHKTQDKEMVQG